LLFFLYEEYIINPATTKKIIHANTPPTIESINIVSDESPKIFGSWIEGGLTWELTDGERFESSTDGERFESGTELVLGDIHVWPYEHEISPSTGSYYI